MGNIKEKIVPHNLDAEVSTLSSMLMDARLIVVARNKLNSNDFFDSRNQVCFNVLLELDDQKIGVDFTTFCNELQMSAQLIKAGGLNYITSLIEYSATTVNFDFYVDILLDLSLKRKIMDTTKEISAMGLDSNLKSQEYVDIAESRIFELSKLRKSTEFSAIKDVCDDIMIITENNKKNKSKVTGLYTGFECLDDITSGFQKEELIILAARPAMGKSALAMNLAVNVAENNKKSKAIVAIFSLEMGNDQLAARMIASKTQINSFNIRTGDLNAEQWRSFEAGCYKLGELNIFFDDSSSVTVNEIRAKCRKLSQAKGLDFVVIDYLQLINGDNRSSSRQEEVSKISRSLKQMAKELKIPVLALSQLSRDAEKTDDKRPVMAHLRESGSIEQDADIICFLHREEYYKKDSTRIDEADLIVAKNRSGSSGIDLNFIFERNFSRFRQKVEKNEN